MDVVDYRDLRRMEYDTGDIQRQALRSGLEQRRMERCADRQQHGALGALGLGDRNATRDRRYMASDHDLAGRIEIDCFHNLALRRLGTRRTHRVVVETQY